VVAEGNELCSHRLPDDTGPENCDSHEILPLWCAIVVDDGAPLHRHRPRTAAVPVFLAAKYLVTADPGGAHLQIIGEHHELGGGTAPQVAAVGGAEGFGGVERGHAQDLVEGQADAAVHVGDGGDHGEVGTGEGAVGEPQGALGADDLAAVQGDALLV